MNIENDSPKTWWFTFGQIHVHSLMGFTFDKDVVVEIDAVDAKASRTKIFDFFGSKWARQYNEKPDLNLFPRGIKKL